MGKGSPNNRSVFDFKPGTLQVDRPNDGVLGQPLSPAPTNVSPFVSIGAAPMQTPQPTAFVSVGAAPVQTPQPIQAPEPVETNITVNTPMETAPATLDLSDDGGIDIEPATPFVPRPEQDPRSFVGEPSDASAQSSGFGKGGTRGGSSFGRFGSRGFSKGARGFNQGGSVMRALMGLIGRQPEFQAQLAGGPPNAQLAFNTMFGIPMPTSGGLSGVSVADPQAIFNIRADASGDPETKAMLRAGIDPNAAVPMQEGGTLDQAFAQGFKAGVLEPIISTPIPNNADAYGSAAGLTSLMRPNVYQGVNAYNRGIPVGQPTTPAAIQMAQGFANPSIFSYNNPNPQGGGTMPSGLAGVAQAQQQQPGQMPMAGQAPNQIQPYTMGT